MLKGKLRAIIVDDEEPAREQVRLHLEKIGGFEILAEVDDVQSAKEEILFHKPDVVFLDIELHRVTVFDMLKNLSIRKGLTFTVVFVTAHYETYIATALESCGLVRKVAYLRKPIDADKMKEVVEKIRDEVQLRRKGRLIFTSGNEKVIIPYENILYCSTEGPDDKPLPRNHIGIYTINDEKIYIRESLSQLFNKLPEDQFYKMSGSHIINIDYVVKIKNPNEKYVCLLKHGRIEKTIVVPERQFQALKLAFPDN